MIELTKVEGHKALINVQHIVWLASDVNNTTYICLTSGSYKFQEPYEQVVALIAKHLDLYKESE